MADNDDNMNNENDENGENQEEQVEERPEEDPNIIILKEQENKFAQDIRENLSNIQKTANNGSYAYVKLNLAEKEIERIFPLISSYTHLRYIDLSGNQIQNIGTIVELKYVIQLNLQRNQIRDLKIFNPESDEEILPYLQFLSLQGNKIQKLEHLKLSKIRRLEIQENEIVEIDDNFGGINSLEYLNISQNKLKSLKGIKDMQNLKELIAEENEIENFKDLENLPMLNQLSLRKNSIKKINFLIPSLTSLYHLNLAENLIEDFKQILKIPKLKSLLSFSFNGNPCNDTLADADPKMEFFIKFDYFLKINDELVNEDFQKEKIRVLEEREEQRKKEEEEARIAAEEARIAAEEARIAAEEVERQAQEEARLAAEEQARLVAEEQAKLAAEEQAKQATEEQAKQEIDANNQEDQV